MNNPNEILDEPLMRLVTYISAKTLKIISTLEKRLYGSIVKPFKTVRDLVECDIEDVKSLLIYKLGRDYQSVLFEIEEGLALAKLKIKNSDFTPYDIRYERLNFPETIMEKFRKNFPSAKTAGDISMLGTKRLVRAGITYHDLSRYINKIMENLDMVIESDKKSVLRHSTYAKPKTSSTKRSQPTKLATSIERNEEARKIQRSFEKGSQIKVYKLGDDEEIKDGKIVKKVAPVAVQKPSTPKHEASPKQSKTPPQTTPSKPVDSHSNQTTIPQTKINTPKVESSKATPVEIVSVTPNQAILDMTIEEFGFSKRTLAGLHKIGTIKTVGNLSDYGKNRLKNSVGIGSGAILEIEALLFKHGIALCGSRSFKKGIFKSHGPNAQTITAEEIKKLSLSELKKRVSDQRYLGNNNQKKKVVPTEIVASNETNSAIKETSPTITKQAEPAPKKTNESTIKQKKKRVKKAKIIKNQKTSVPAESEKVLPNIEISNLAFALKQFGITVLERVSEISFAENSSDFDEIKIAVNDYFNNRIASTIEVAPSSVALDKMKQKIFDEMTEYEKIVTKKREIIKSSKLDIKRKSASIVLRSTLKSLMDKFYQNIPASGLISGDRVKFHKFTGSIIAPENSIEQRQM